MGRSSTGCRSRTTDRTDSLRRPPSEASEHSPAVRLAAWTHRSTKGPSSFNAAFLRGQSGFAPLVPTPQRLAAGCRRSYDVRSRQSARRRWREDSFRCQSLSHCVLTVLQPRHTPWYLRNSGGYGCVEKSQVLAFSPVPCNGCARSDDVWGSRYFNKMKRTAQEARAALKLSTPLIRDRERGDANSRPDRDDTDDVEVAVRWWVATAAVWATAGSPGSPSFDDQG